MNLRTLLRTVAALALFTASAAFGQLNSGQSTDLNLNAQLDESLTVTLDQSTIHFTLVSGSDSNPGSTGVNAGVSWVLNSGRTAVKLYAYFDSPTAALTNSTNSTYVIPSSAVFATVGGSSVGSFTSSTPFGGLTGVVISNTTITTNLVGSTSSAVTLNIDLSSLPTLSAGSYTGTLHFQAQATT
jgi:hypothetical protein